MRKGERSAEKNQWFLIMLKSQILGRNVGRQNKSSNFCITLYWYTLDVLEENFVGHPQDSYTKGRGFFTNQMGCLFQSNQTTVFS